MPAAADPRAHSGSHAVGPLLPPHSLPSHTPGINVGSHMSMAPAPHHLPPSAPHIPARQLPLPPNRTNLITVPIQDNHNVPPPSHNVPDMNMAQNYYHHGYYAPQNSAIPPVLSPQINPLSSPSPHLQMNSVQATMAHSMSVPPPTFYNVASGPPSGYSVPSVYVSQSNQMGLPQGGYPPAHPPAPGAWPPQPVQPSPQQQHFYR